MTALLSALLTHWSEWKKHELPTIGNKAFVPNSEKLVKWEECPISKPWRRKISNKPKSTLNCWRVMSAVMMIGSLPIRLVRVMSDDRFGQRLAKDDISEKNFNKYLKELQTINKKSGSKSTDGKEDYGWISELLLDPQLPTVQTWMTKYAGTNLAYVKDLSIAYNSVTQLGAVYTGGKYESLLKNRPRKSLNDDDLNLFN